jgi:hypothetical protein
MVTKEQDMSNRRQQAKRLKREIEWRWGECPCPTEIALQQERARRWGFPVMEFYADDC